MPTCLKGTALIFTTVINCDTNGFGGLSGAFRFRLDDEVSQRNTNVQRA